MKRILGVLSALFRFPVRVGAGIWRFSVRLARRAGRIMEKLLDPFWRGGVWVVKLVTRPAWKLLTWTGMGITWALRPLLKRVVLGILRWFWRKLVWPFRLRGAGRERLILGLIFFFALCSAALAYPPLWNRPAVALKSRVEAWGNWGGAVSYKDWITHWGQIVSPESLPDVFLGRNLKEYSLGLDLVGGAHLEYAIDLSKVSASDRDEAADALRDTIERRVNIFGVKEPLVQLVRVGQEKRLIVELAGVSDVGEAVKRVGDPIFLEFKEEIALPTTGPNGEPLDASQLQIDPSQRFHSTDPQLTGKYLTRAEVVFDPNTNQPQVQLTFNDEGAKIFQDLTKKNVGKRIAIFLDEYPVSAPVVQQEISGGTAVITGSFTVDEAKVLARNLNAGALPVPISLIAQRTVGATLGKESLHEMIQAGIAALVLIAAFMLFLYRIPGLLALIALLLYTAFMLALFKLVPITMTLAGIAGLVLSIGMAVDANILIFARMREERRQGRDVRTALEEGFRRAWPAIRDSNIATLLTTTILYMVGTSFVQGFALALGVGVLLSMFTAIVISRFLMREAVRHPRLTKYRIFWY